jgi:hypothetical protein
MDVGKLSESRKSVTDLAQIELAIPVDAVDGDRYASMLMAHLDSDYTRLSL